jgi:hypothetical protein
MQEAKKYSIMHILIGLTATMTPVLFWVVVWFNAELAYSIFMYGMLSAVLLICWDIIITNLS